MDYINEIVQNISQHYKPLTEMISDIGPAGVIAITGLSYIAGYVGRKAESDAAAWREKMIKENDILKKTGLLESDITDVGLVNLDNLKTTMPQRFQRLDRTRLVAILTTE